MEYPGAGGKLIHEKSKAKNLVTLSLYANHSIWCILFDCLKWKFLSFITAYWAMANEI